MPIVVAGDGWSLGVLERVAGIKFFVLFGEIEGRFGLFLRGLFVPFR